jgi:hypothetical protein
LTFSCRAEEIAVSCAKSFQRLIPEIFDDEMLGTFLFTIKKDI